MYSSWYVILTVILLLSGVTKMSRNAKKAIVGALGGLGLVMILLGALAHIYPTTTGIIIAIALWVTSGILSKYWNLDKSKIKKASGDTKE